MRRWTVAGLLVAAAAVGAWQLRPERFAVNAPLRQMLLGRGVAAPDRATVDARLRAPAGFSISLWASGLPNARFLRFTGEGDLLLSTPRRGRVTLLLPDRDGDGRSDGRQVLLEGLDRPQGLDVHAGWLYVGESGAVVRAPFDAAARRVTGPTERVVALPSGGNHWTRTVRFGPDGLLYVSIGSSCNACVESDPRRAALLRFQPDGSGQEIFATGLRNSEGFDWRPGTGELYATDNGRDLLGDDIPPCELNRIVRGGFYGWPFAYGDRVPDPDLGAGHEREIAESLAPVHAFRAHNAPLGMTFVRGDALPAAYRGAAIVALHGSWNRTRKDGYRVVSLHFGPDGIERRDLVTGFEEGGDVIGRPVDVAEGPDGALYVSDDYAGAIYRVAWVGAGVPALARRPGAPEVVAARPAPRPRDPLAGLDPDQRQRLVDRGERIYRSHACATCHEADHAPPGTVVKPLRGLSSRHDLEDLVAFLAAPTPPMPAVDLDPSARRALAVHLLARHP